MRVQASDKGLIAACLVDDWAEGDGPFEGEESLRTAAVQHLTTLERHTYRQYRTKDQGMGESLVVYKQERAHR